MPQEEQEAKAPPKVAPEVVRKWQMTVNTRLNQFKRYPRQARARAHQGTVKVAFVLDSEGHVVSSRVVKSSGSPILDQETLDLVERAQPYPVPPAGTGGHGFIPRGANHAMRCADASFAPQLLLGFGLALLAMTGPARAHPHVWVTMKSEVIYASDGSVTGIRHAWSFDDMFSTYALQGIEHKKNGVYTREELAPLAETNVTSLKEYKYFNYAWHRGQEAQGRLQRPGRLLARLYRFGSHALFHLAAQSAGARA